MADLDLSVLIDRTSLGLAPLEINDHETYYVAPSFLGGQATWNRVQVNSPYSDGQFTTHRTLQNVSEPVTVEVLGDTVAEVTASQQTLIEAFSQSFYLMTVLVAGQTFIYDCEAADFTPVVVGSRLIAPQLQIAFTVYRQPLARSGGF